MILVAMEIEKRNGIQQQFHPLGSEDRFPSQAFVKQAGVLARGLPTDSTKMSNQEIIVKWSRPTLWS